MWQTSLNQVQGEVDKGASEKQYWNTAVILFLNCLGIHIRGRKKKTKQSHHALITFLFLNKYIFFVFYVPQLANKPFL